MSKGILDIDFYSRSTLLLNQLGLSRGLNAVSGLVKEGLHASKPLSPKIDPYKP